MADVVLGKDWFEMTDTRRRRWSNSVWIPLRQAEWLSQRGEDHQLGFIGEFLAIGSIKQTGKDFVKLFQFNDFDRALNKAFKLAAQTD